jgi:hypothetical protein
MVGLGRMLASGAALTVAALLAVVFVGLIVETGRSEEQRPVVLGIPKSVLALENEARKDVENDATNAGLEALQHSKSSLTASLTGGLKRDLQASNLAMNFADDFWQ